jgi:aspartate aminotransferase-like enzyme
LLDVPPVGAAEYAGIEERCREVLGTGQELFVFQGEAVVALEAAARGLGRPGAVALNLVTGPYGGTFGDWLSGAGARVENLAVPFDRAVAADEVAAALGRVGHVDVVSVVHAEAATGVVNDLAAIAEVAKSRGAVVVVDAVASVGAEPLAIDAWGLDFVVLSAQKALAGPSGVSMVTVSPEAWEALERHPSPWRRSVLSLLDWRDDWVGAGRSSLPVIPAHLETRALGAAMERVAKEGLCNTVARHRAASAATRAALGPLGLQPWVREPADATSVATLVRSPVPGPQALLAAVYDTAAPIGAAPGALAQEALRVNHTGANASLTSVRSAVAALAQGLRALGHQADLGAAIALANEAWDTASAGR